VAVRERLDSSNQNARANRTVLTMSNPISAEVVKSPGCGVVDEFA
jgi:hypothetical protein